MERKRDVGERSLRGKKLPRSRESESKEENEMISFLGKWAK